MRIRTVCDMMWQFGENGERRIRNTMDFQCDVKCAHIIDQYMIYLGVSECGQGKCWKGMTLLSMSIRLFHKLII